MTESEWLASDDLELLLNYLGKRVKGRRLRLLASGLCRRAWDLLDVPSQEALSLSELHADKLIKTAQLSAAARKASEIAESKRWESLVTMKRTPRNQADAAQATALAVSKDCSTDSLLQVAALVRMTRSELLKETRLQCTLLRCIFGNPFRPVAIDPSWHTATVRSLAEGIYAERAFDRLPILADALQEAGCTTADILNHCRQPGEHVRGCWAVDAVLGRK